MRRPVLYLAGMLLATGASLALAGPASAAPGHVPCPYSQGYSVGYPTGYSDGSEHNSFNGIQLLGNQGSGNQGGLIPILSPFS
jgi:hypothetical protein